MPPSITPLVVSVDLASPWVDRGDPIHLDGLLMEAACRRYGAPEMTRLSSLDGLRSPPIPLYQVETLGLCCPLSSAAEVVSPAAPAMVYQVKRRDAEDWDQLDRPVNVAAGPNRDRLERTQAQVAAGLQWYAWGNRGRVMDLLRLLWGPGSRPLGFLGSKRRSGAGQITAWRVETGSHDAERCLLRDGRAARHMPAEWALSAERWRRGAWRSPYWHPERQEPVPWVGVGVDLHPEVHAALTRATADAAG